MAGKSTYIRQVALIALLAQIGQLRARPPRRAIGLVDRIFTRVGAQRRPQPRPEHVHGRDDRDGQHPQQRHRPQPGDPRRDRARHEHLRRRQHRLGGGRAHRTAASECRDALRHALPRADRAGRDARRAIAQLQRRRARVGGRDHLPAARSSRAAPTRATASTSPGWPACRAKSSSAPRRSWPTSKTPLSTTRTSRASPSSPAAAARGPTDLQLILFSARVRPRRRRPPPPRHLHPHAPRRPEQARRTQEDGAGERRLIQRLRVL